MEGAEEALWTGKRLLSAPALDNTACRSFGCLTQASPPAGHSLLPQLRCEAAAQLEGDLQAGWAVCGGVHNAQAAAAHAVALHCGLAGWGGKWKGKARGGHGMG